MLWRSMPDVWMNIGFIIIVIIRVISSLFILVVESVFSQRFLLRSLVSRELLLQGTVGLCIIIKDARRIIFLQHEYNYLPRRLPRISPWQSDRLRWCPGGISWPIWCTVDAHCRGSSPLVIRAHGNIWGIYFFPEMTARQKRPAGTVLNLSG